jgi:polysaccharide biosynthesis protein PslG
MQHVRWIAASLFCLIIFSFTNALLAQSTTITPTSSPTSSMMMAQSTLAPTPIPPTATPALESYTVQPGDTLFRIAVRFRTTVRALAAENGITNPSIIFVGQRLRIPGSAVTPTPTSTPSQSTTTYTVVRGDTLFRVAIRFNTTVSRLISLNNLANPNIIYVGQRLTVPTQSSIPTPTALPVLPATPGTGGGSIAPETDTGFGYGIEVYFPDQNTVEVVSELTDIGVSWVKIDVAWRDLEQAKGQIDFTSLDNAISALEAENFNILLTVSTSPAWARTSTEEDGPPDTLADYATFIGALAQRYAGRVGAYEIWNEPNLRREWNSTVHNISAASYIELLRQSYSAVKTADSAAIVVSAGLAPTGFNDGVNALNDRLYLSALYSAGLSSVSDAIGSHPNGWANPPDAVCCQASAGVSTHYEDPSFYFLNTLNDYRQIMLQNNDGDSLIWVTRFGWGSSEGLGAPSAINVFLTYTSSIEQSTYVPRGFQLGSELGFIGPMFVYNLNGCQSVGETTESCYYSFLDSDGQPRPVYSAVQGVIPAAQPESTPVVTLIPSATTADMMQPTAVETAAPTQITQEATEQVTEDAMLIPTSESLQPGVQTTPEVTP